MMAGFVERAKGFADRLAGAGPLAAVADQLAEVLDENHILAEDIDRAALEGTPLLLNALQELPAEQAAEARRRGGPVAMMIPRGAYGIIIEELSRTHPEHARVLFAHRDWTHAQLDAARRWLANGSG